MTYGCGAQPSWCFFFFQAEDGIRDLTVTGVQTCALPISAVIFDFDLAPGSKADRWPTAADAYRACEAASTEIAEGSVGAGTGATVGKALGPRGAMKGGVGTWAARAAIGRAPGRERV